MLLRFRTYGAAIGSLSASLQAGLRRAELSYGTTGYFRVRAVAVHRAYDSWCTEHGFVPAQRAALRQSICAHVHCTGGQFSTTAIDVFCKELPDEYNVRGEWQSELVG